MSNVTQKKILVVEDDPGLQKQMRWCLDGYQVYTASNREDAISQLNRYGPAVVLLDLGLPPDPENASEGMKALDEILAAHPLTKVIVVTGNDDRANAVEAISKGAYDYYHKPIDPEVLSLLVERAYYLYELELEHKKLQSLTGGAAVGNIITNSSEMLSTCRMIERVAPVDVTTLILGESGTGKELVARSLHSLSSRADNKFVAINCAAIPETLLESELFGYEKGAFTGANKRTIGKIEFADRGTLFLDEIGDLPQSLQAKLLRFLQEHTIERIGSRSEIPVDVRVVCATHQNLKSKIADGSFREDLYYRISEMVLNIPPLRDRKGDILLLAKAFLVRYSNDLGRKFSGFTTEALSALEGYSWPGNVRELENKIKRAVILEDGTRISPQVLEINTGDNQSKEEDLNLRIAKDNLEKSLIQRALLLSDGNVSLASDKLGVSRPTLYTMIEKYNLK